MKLTKTGVASILLLGLFALSHNMSAQAKIQLKGKLNLNSASVAELVMLPGIGEKKAKDIMDLKKSIKEFKYTDDLLKVKGLGVKLYKGILPYIKIGGKSDLTPINSD